VSSAVLKGNFILYCFAIIGKINTFVPKIFKIYYMFFRNIILFLFAASFQLNAQQWNVITADKIIDKGIKDIQPDKYILYTFDDATMQALLWNAPAESDIDVSKSTTTIQVALPNATTESFSIVRYDMMEPELAAKFPEIKTFYGIAVNNPLKSIRIDYTLQGFRAVISSPEDGKIFIDHYQRNDKNTRIVYYKSDYKKVPSWGCGVTEEHIGGERIKSGGTRIGDCQLRSYRLAQATTGEYSLFHGNTPTSVMAAVVNVINRINQVYEAEVAVRLILVANTNLIFYYNSATDPYLNTSGDLTNNQNTCNSVIGNSNYDIGHLFGTGGGGVAGLGVVCSSGNKARGLTGSSSPVGDPFTIDYVAHELGHQFGGNHTQNNNCNRNNATAMEPGSASSIMGYAGICNPDVQSNSDAYFHAISLQEMKTFINTGSSCETFIGSFVNTAPTVSPQSSYTIPVSTPFLLTLSATDAQSHPMTYAWEQMDNSVATMPPVSTNTGGPTFRSITASTAPSRYFPNLATVISGATSNTWEVVPSVARTMNFRGVVRDFTGVAGCNSEINITVTTVNAAAGAFSVTSFNSASTWAAGDTKTITWNVAGSNTSPVSAANVDILLSYDGGNTYPVTLVSATPNDGTHNITVPAGTTAQGRIMVRGSGHIFYDINNTNISITAGGGGTFDLTATPSTVNACLGSPLITSIGVNGTGGFSSPVTLSVTGLPIGANASFSNNPVNPGSTPTLTITGINSLGSYNIVVNGVSGAINKTVPVTLNVATQTPAPSLSIPLDGATVVSVTPVLSWSIGAGAISYSVQIAYDASFSDIAISVNTSPASYQPTTPLYGATTFYWRVRMTDNCGVSLWSTARSFTTESCWFYTATNVPLNIDVAGGQSVYSYLNIPDRGDITDLNITDLRGTASPISDFKFTLFNPSNVSDLFWNMPCPGRFADFNIKFDDEAASSNWPCSPIDGLTYIPSSPLSALDGYQMKGSWKLGIQNLGASSSGILEAWEIKNCVNNFCRLTVDHTRASGAGSLVEAINCALAGDTIKFATNIQNDTFFLGNQNLVISKSIFIECDINQNIHIMSNSASPTLVCTASTAGNGLKIKGVHIHSSNQAIGAIQNTGKLILEDVLMHKWPGPATATILNLSGANTLFLGNCGVVEY